VGDPQAVQTQVVQRPPTDVDNRVGHGPTAPAGRKQPVQESPLRAKGRAVVEYPTSFADRGHGTIFIKVTRQRER
jgi:hypothetical protein